MIIPEEQTTICDAWRTAASALSIRIEAPYILKTPDGEDVSCVAYLPDFGGARGMVISLIRSSDPVTDKRVASAAKSQGLFYSFINPEAYEFYDESVFLEALTDWGFFGNENHRPAWSIQTTC